MVRSIGIICRKWRLLFLLLLPQVLPPFASSGYRLDEWAVLNAFIITHPVKWMSFRLYPFFQVFPLLLTFTVFVLGNRVSRWFSLYIGLSYLQIAVLQSISVSKLWGTAICTANLVTFLALAALWLLEFSRPQNQLNLRGKQITAYWPLVLALFAFWEPVNPLTLQPDFNPLYLLQSGAGLSFCMATPLFLAVLILSFPTVNKFLMAGTALVGLFMGFGNLLLEFILNPTWWWIGCLHFSLVILSAYSLILVFRHTIQEDRAIRST